MILTRNEHDLSMELEIHRLVITPVHGGNNNVTHSEEIRFKLLN